MGNTLDAVELERLEPVLLGSDLQAAFEVKLRVT